VRLPDEVLEEVKEYAFERGVSMTEVFEEALREHLARAKQERGRSRRVRLPTFAGDGLQPGVDLHDSPALLDRMEERFDGADRA
jgi:hypothetical protein